MRAEWAKGHLSNQSYWNKKVVKNMNESYFVKHTRGKPITKEEKQMCLNIYQKYVDEGRDHGHAVSKTAVMSGISKRAIEKIVKERSASGTVVDNNRKFRNTKTAFEKLSEEQTKR